MAEQTTYRLRYTSAQGRRFETEHTSVRTGARLRREAEEIAREEIALHRPSDQLVTLSIDFAGAGDLARR